MSRDPEDRISLHPNPQRVRILADGAVIADTTHALELREMGYPPRQYIPREDVDMARLVRTDTVTHCPFKGDASYYALRVDGRVLPDAAWSYERPYAAMSRIAGMLSFTPGAVEERTGRDDRGRAAEGPITS